MGLKFPATQLARYSKEILHLDYSSLLGIEAIEREELETISGPCTVNHPEKEESVRLLVRITLCRTINKSRKKLNF